MGKTTGAAMMLILLYIAINVVVTTHFVAKNDVFDLSDSANCYTPPPQLEETRV